MGIQPIAEFSSTQRHPLGFTVDAYDPTYGSGTFVYLAGVASTVVGSVVSYNQLTGVTALVPNTANLGRPLAVAMSANIVATTWGWYQVRGAAVIKKSAINVAPSVKLYISATTGRLMPTAASGKQVLNAITVNAASVASATSTITAQINFPFAQGATA
jgi:hypothetical protein